MSRLLTNIEADLTFLPEDPGNWIYLFVLLLFALFGFTAWMLS
jgi:hypothetical protein